MTVAAATSLDQAPSWQALNNSEHFKSNEQVKAWTNYILAQAVFFFAMVAAVPASIASDGCDQISHSRQVHICALADWEAAQHRVAVAWSQLAGRIEQGYSVDPQLHEEIVAVAERSQLAWTASVQADCALGAFEIEAGTQAYEATIFSCSAIRYRQRAEFLDGQVLN